MAAQGAPGGVAEEEVGVEAVGVAAGAAVGAAVGDEAEEEEEEDEGGVGDTLTRWCINI
jgi:hypothetical protein